jgi:hypothetical protein
MQQIVIRSKQNVARFINERLTSQNAWWMLLIALGGVFIEHWTISSNQAA